jgi:eukaryotic-like serine/threonine-protein kinase
MSVSDDKQDLLDSLLVELMSQYRSNAPSQLDQFCDENPTLASSIRELYPTLCFLEQNKPKPKTAFASPNEWLKPDGCIGDYQLIREVGRGGMGVVYEALQLSLHRHVALKIISQHLASNPSAIARFQREARSAAHLHHSNIVPVFDVGTDNSTCYFAMQFIQGQSLDQVIEELWRVRGKPVQSGIPSTSEIDISALLTRGELDATTAKRSLSSQGSQNQFYYRNVARLGLQMAEALAYAHERGIVHRDIKPANILIDQTGVAWITDFGLAKYKQSTPNECEESDLTHTGDLLGTLRYLAPERLRGTHDALGDIYGLGATLYELLALRPVFDSRDKLSLMKDIADRAPIPLRQLDSQVPRDLETIVHKCVAR